jgi:hypothetical protein
MSQGGQMFGTLTAAETRILRAYMTSAAGKVLSEAQQLAGFPGARDAYGVDASDYLSMLAEITTVTLDTYPAVTG